MKAKLKTPQEIELMRQSGQALGRILEQLAKSVKPGVSAKKLAQEAREAMQKLGVKPAFLGYQGFPDVICISLNSEIVHGIPGEKVIKEGDVVSLDLGVSYQGWISDGALTLIAGKSTQPRAEELLRATKEALEAGIQAAQAGQRVGDISWAIEQRLVSDQLGIFESLEGHGVGKKVHEPPSVPNFGTAGQGPLLVPGMTLAIEPMAGLGTNQVQVLADGWTIVTRDSSLASHFEHTVLIAEAGPEILTLP